MGIGIASRIFLACIGDDDYMTSPKKRVVHLYRSPDCLALGVKADRFYSCPEWNVVREETFRRFGDRCLCCGGSFRMAVDHILPRSLYPDHELDPGNLQPLCQSCNSRKSNRDTTDYRPEGLRIPLSDRPMRWSCRSDERLFKRTFVVRGGTRVRVRKRFQQSWRWTECRQDNEFLYFVGRVRREDAYVFHRDEWEMKVFCGEVEDSLVQIENR